MPRLTSMWVATRSRNHRSWGDDHGAAEENSGRAFSRESQGLHIQVVSGLVEQQQVAALRASAPGSGRCATPLETHPGAFC